MGAKKEVKIEEKPEEKTEESKGFMFCWTPVIKVVDKRYRNSFSNRKDRL